MTSIIIVAAGLSTRMGKDNKLLLPFLGKALYLHFLDAALKSRAGECILVTGHESDSIVAALGNRKVRVVHHPNYEHGLTSSIQAGVRSLHPDCKAFMIGLSDMPFVTTHHINTLIAAYEQGPKPSITMPLVNQKRSHPLLFDISFKGEILSHGQPNGCKEVVLNNKAVWQCIHFKEDFHQDVDTPEEYQVIRNTK